ncbi:MAG: hypothetical protein WC381_10965 [Kiritimatiellia bacterium]|jgi:hypothetical protein
MNGGKFVTKCCVCGREKTDQGWQYAFQDNEQKVVYSHGFCSACYDVEVMKVKMRFAMPEMAMAR